VAFQGLPAKRGAQSPALITKAAPPDSPDEPGAASPSSEATARSAEHDPQGAEAADDALLAEAFPHLRRVSGIDFSAYKPSTLRRRIERRAGLGRHASIRAYLDTVRDDPAEAVALAEDMLIHVTRFFRDTSVFDALARQVLPRILAEKPPGEAVRVWVPGCATGEEVYSLVIAILEEMHASGHVAPLKVFGTDLSEAAIETARAGRYPTSIENDVAPERLARFFVRHESEYAVRKEIREHCVFARHDLTRDPPFSRLDLLSCRNLMIYLATPAQRRVLPALHYALRPGGVLVLGASESPVAFTGFEPLDASQRLYVRTGSAARGDGPPTELPRWPTPPITPRLPSPPGPLADVQREADRAVLAAYAPPGVVITEDLTVVQFRGQTGAFLEPVPGAASLDLLKLAREELRIDLRAAIERARQTHQRATQRGTSFRAGDVVRHVDIEVFPLLAPTLGERHFAVLFHEQPAAAPAATALPESANTAQRALEDTLRGELAATRAYLESVIEQLEVGNEELRAANEEVLSSNEELQSTNEELQTAQEELQSSNEELSIVNTELSERNRETRRIHDDLSNVLSSSALALLLLDREARIRRFTPEAERHLSLIATDVGRPIADIRPRLATGDLATAVRDVFTHLTPYTATVRDPDDRWFQLAIRPYLTTDGRVDGAVVTIVDVDDLVRGRSLLAEARDFAERVVEGIAEPLVVLDEEHRVRVANHAFCEAFGFDRQAAAGRTLEQLGAPGCLVALLRETVTRLARGERVDHVRVESPDHAEGDRSLLLAGRVLPSSEAPRRSFLLTFIDVTRQEAREEGVRAYRRELQELVLDTTLAEERLRRRIAEGLHDQVGQSLALAQQRIAEARQHAGAAAAHALDGAHRLVEAAVEDIRTLTFELSPPILYDLGLPPALGWLAEQLAVHHRLEVAVSAPRELAPLDDETASLVFRAVRELLLNVAKHARTPRSRVALRSSTETLTVIVADDGVGFDPTTQAATQAPRRFGLFSVREQILRLGGAFDVCSAPGHGTFASIVVPLVRPRARPPSARPDVRRSASPLPRRRAEGTPE
jgi:two-component system CheB/CheR fusion protein